ncbi:protein serine/threonine kinase, putative [Entamoeba invadens IP1]|uniref:Protein serine/threonine kinase, putative n=1 Tax=Entamoeba invadens IP1 TaxID=370355 RepID=A0A0A1U859_ENTIV|nr:protein serine/threonine kinase, putative [Entamoeba invadens IP1]ELP91119.1 protein serine/threonine kinase, putative [Entamoeba invadens IP1]|eukprot:XP_004257890.1 protein serine/threonine kinase, putative [Entamoeba invadens IP1]
MISFAIMLFFVAIANSYECDCYPIGMKQSDGFISYNNSKCDDNVMLSISSICLDKNFYFISLNSIGSLILSSSNVFIIRSNSWINVLQLFDISKNTNVILQGYFHSNLNLTIEDNATINVYGSFSIGGEFLIENPQLDKPPIVLWQSNWLHLYSNVTNKAFFITNPIGNSKCFDVFSMNSPYCLNSDNNDNRLNTTDFPYNFTDGTAFLLSNSRLMRFCPKNIPQNKTVVCTLNQSVYQTNYNGNKNYAFEYPHCPCDDSNTICYLYINQNISIVTLQHIEMLNTILVIDKDVKIYNANKIKEIQMKDDICVNITSLFEDGIIKFSFGILIVKESNTQITYFLNYNSTVRTLSLYPNLNFDIEISSITTEIKMEVEGIINNIFIGGNCFVLFKEKMTEIHKLTLTESFSTNDIVLFYFENKTVENLISPNCILMKSSLSKTICLECNYKTRLDDGICVGLTSNCKTFNMNNYCVECEIGFYLDADNKCIQNNNNCQIGDENKCIKCDNYHVVLYGVCISNNKCEWSNGINCLKCYEGELNTNCDTCSDVNCMTCKNSECIICHDNYYLGNDGICHSTIENSIYFYNNIVYCVDGYYINNSECNNCLTTNANWTKCDIEKPTKCSTNYGITESGNCESTTCKEKEKMEQNGRCSETQDNCVFTLNNKCVECIDNYTTDDSGNCILNSGNNSQVNCKETTKYGCARCDDKYYLIHGNCVSCDSNCGTCLSTSTFCLSCKEGTFLSQHKCITNNNLDGVCIQFIPSGGCVKCTNGYFRSGLSCEKCDVKCGTCNNRESCLTCNSSNYRTSNNECKPQSDIVGCQLETTQNGCSKCSGRYFTVNTNECEKCNETCLTCLQTKDVCTSCDTNDVLVDSKCIDISLIANCKEAGQSKCTKCSFWYIPSANGTYCNSHIVWWMIIVIVIICIMTFIVLTTIVFVCIKKIIKKIELKKREKTTTLFNMKKSNISFTSLQGGVCINKTVLLFNTNCDEIPVGKESRELLCVGNIISKTIKIQISSKLNEENYQLKIEPSIVILKKGVACEFSLHLIPNYSSNITSEIALVSKNLSSGVDTFNTIKMIAKTVMTTKLDYHEIIEEKKLGEGSFGVVYKGTFRGNVVAIKKMKQFDNNEKSIDEFDKEVEMMDKFRSEYIVHFYGAVFIPNKVCMVTEFAQFGSLQDLIKNKRNDEVKMKIRVKMMLDGARGILYLHENGILHRDIKPDNILVFSLDLNEKVSAKLTDFGSARNINMLMTNMTFTKGIGSPTYMAPEVLKQEKYKKEADVYSFGVTLFEVCGWCEIYTKSMFKYPWKIAEFVCSGKRVENSNNIPNNLFKIVQNCWKQNPKERCSIQTVVEDLDNVTNFT